MKQLYTRIQKPGKMNDGSSTFEVEQKFTSRWMRSILYSPSCQRLGSKARMAGGCGGGGGGGGGGWGGGGGGGGGGGPVGGLGMSCGVSGGRKRSKATRHRQRG